MPPIHTAERWRGVRVTGFERPQLIVIAMNSIAVTPSKSRRS
jgi:hypothetical protein